MITGTYMRYELLRTFRNRRFFVLSLGFPLVLFFTIAAPNRGVRDLAGSGVGAPLYYMVGMASFGTMSAMLSSGARIATERAAGWTRQLRISPLSPRAYFRAKLITAYAMALVSMLALFLAGASLAVSLPASQWLSMAGLILAGLVPLAALGIVLGHLLTPDAIGPAVGGTVSLLALLGGTWFPLGHGSFLYQLARFLPSYWIVQASHVALGGRPWPALAWGVIAAWTALLALAAVGVYRRDGGRV